MAKYIEDDNNILVQVLDEFINFYTSIICFEKYVNKEKKISNVSLIAMRVLARNIYCFFQNTKNERYDDVIYRDFIEQDDFFVIKVDDTIRTFLNKSTMHLSKKRGKLAFINDDFRILLKNIKERIDMFVKKIENTAGLRKTIDVIKILSNKIEF